MHIVTVLVIWQECVETSSIKVTQFKPPHKKGQHLVEVAESITEVTPILAATSNQADEGPIVHAKLNGYSVSLQLDTGATQSL